MHQHMLGAALARNQALALCTTLLCTTLLALHCPTSAHRAPGSSEAAAKAAAEEQSAGAAPRVAPDGAARQRARRAAKQLRREQRAQEAGGDYRDQQHSEQHAEERHRQQQQPGGAQASEAAAAAAEADAGNDGPARKRARREAKQQWRRKWQQDAEEQHQQEAQQQEQPAARGAPGAVATAPAPAAAAPAAAAAATDVANDGSARKRAKEEAKQPRRQQREQEAGQSREQQQAQDTEERQQQQPPDCRTAAAAAHGTLAAAAVAAEPFRGMPATGSAPAAQAVSAAPDLYKFWSEQDVDRLVRCVEDAAYRRQHVGVDELDWQAIAGHLRRSQQAVRSKYRHQKVTQDGTGRRAPAAVGVRKSITYGSMAVAGLCALPDQSGTGEEICAAIEAHPPFQPLLDRTTRPDSSGVLRWKQRIREELSHRAYFQNSATKRGGEVVWRLNPDALYGLPRKQYRKLEELKLPGAPFLGKLGKDK